MVTAAPSKSGTAPALAREERLCSQFHIPSAVGGKLFDPTTVNSQMTIPCACPVGYVFLNLSCPSLPVNIGWWVYTREYEILNLLPQ